MQPHFSIFCPCYLPIILSRTWPIIEELRRECHRGLCAGDFLIDRSLPSRSETSLGLLATQSSVDANVRRMSARSDISLYSCEDGTVKDKVANIELKAHNCSAQDIQKDVEKLVKERQVGNWFHCLTNVDRSTLRVLLEKLEQSFQSVAKPDTITPLIVFCFCVLEKNWAMVKCFDPSRESVSQFFDFEYAVAGGFVNVIRDNGWRCIRSLK